MNPMLTEREDEVYGLLAEFGSPEALLSASKVVKEAGYTRIDGFTPFPVEDLGKNLGFHSSQVQKIVLIAGIIGAISGYLIQYIPTVILYPINVGGRPLNSIPSFMPITFETTILFAALTATVGMFILNRLPQLHHPVFNTPEFTRASRDRFFLLIERQDRKFSYQTTRALLASLNPLGVYDVPI